MATIAGTDRKGDPAYKTGDGKPMAETPLHMGIMIDLIQCLQDHFEADPNVYIGGNMFIHYVQGDKRKHLAPDVYVVRGVPKQPERVNFIVWEEGKAPDLVIEVTSKTTRKIDQTRKLALYRDVLRVPEYFQFDPTKDYLRPPLQGFRLVDEVYVPIEPVAGRLPSLVLGLEFERDGKELRLYDPSNQRRLLTRLERIQEAEAEVDQLRREVEQLRRQRGKG